MIDDLHTTSTGQSTHQDSVTKILSATQFVTEVLPAEHSFHQKVLPAVHLFYKKILSVGQCILVSIMVYQFIGTNLFVLKMIRIQIFSDNNDKMCKNQQ